MSHTKSRLIILKMTNGNVYRKNVICYRQGNYEKICRILEGINFQHEINNRSIDSAFEFFHSTMESLVTNNIPRRTITINPNRPVWWTRKLQQLKNRRDKLYKRKKFNRDNSEYESVLEVCG